MSELLRRVHQTYQPVLVTSESIKIHAYHFLYHTSQRASSSPHVDTCTCLIAVTVMTKKSGRPLVTGLVGVSTITCREKKTILLTTGFQAAEDTKPLVMGEKGCSAHWGSQLHRGVGQKGAREKDQHKHPQECSPSSQKDYSSSSWRLLDVLSGKKPFQKYLKT